ncbi:formiminoglutamase [Dongia mobilis]|uniref:Formiminoglutamase n=1 Tax=Dongia mobilis TaxID=578943 RepID=A0A4R6WNM7_9PROT|nr:N-formylglutamate deformylase [Dongia mobilis]TDQ80560.1 formiminoglutamase [Dongia mobilis]
MTIAYDFIPGASPLLISMPHVGTELMPEVAAGLSEPAKGLCDTDWHLPILYDFASELGAGLLIARWSRFNIDLNRPSDDKPLYATATTGLYPDVLFDGTPLYEPGREPSPAVRARYLAEIWQPYHDRLAAELAARKKAHGHAVLFDAHSIKGHVPRLFAGDLPDFNIGTNSGASCAEQLTARLAAACDSSGYTHVVNGRFKGGHITRQYGRPADGIHAVQLELAQRTYMREAPPFDYLPEVAARVRPVLKRFVEILAGWRP